MPGGIRGGYEICSETAVSYFEVGAELSDSAPSEHRPRGEDRPLLVHAHTPVGVFGGRQASWRGAESYRGGSRFGGPWPGCRVDACGPGPTLRLGTGRCGGPSGAVVSSVANPPALTHKIAPPRLRPPPPPPPNRRSAPKAGPTDDVALDTVCTRYATCHEHAPPPPYPPALRPDSRWGSGVWLPHCLTAIRLRRC